ncbi:TrkH family potassium uptake protein [Candidatus Aerophobetes bacterium]|uniref:TrkH family potassium uptake protein n=1 Tax=Aerophobetes bacterium TaxID=2030807 RepID=A0A523ZHV1_UNCAE|nr:MAG: TrkH family potassium uptake protein [Candidatus Aerophobetes bacterium]
MNLKVVFYSVGKLTKFLGALMGIPCVLSLIYREPDFLPLAISVAVTLLGGYLIERFCSRAKDEEIRHREAFAIVSLGWVVVAFFGTIPFLLAGTFSSFIDAYFESMSGFTATGATVLTNIESQPHGILFWRNFTQWLGGMGIIVLGIAILPKLAVGGRQLMAAEFPGPLPERLKPRIAETAKIIWGIYLLFSFSEVLLLKLTGLSLFDSVIHTFSTMATGGFSSHTLNIGFFDRPGAETVITCFMFLAGGNFALYYYFLKGNPRRLFKDSEFRFYSFVMIAAILLVTFNLWGGTYKSIWSSFRYAAFQVVSINTTTGFTTQDFDLWPPLSRGILLLLMFIGGCAGGTAGAIKNMRILILLKKGYQELLRLVHPRAVIPVRLGGRPVEERVIAGITGFFILYILVFLVSSLILMKVGLDMVSSVSATAATMGTVGPGLGLVGASQNYAFLPPLAKAILCLNMLLGRLEIYTVLVLLLPSTWRK